MRRLIFAVALLATVGSARAADELSGADKLTTYEFNTKTAKHFFCSVCGIKSFYVPRSHPDGYSVNLRCLEPNAVRIVNLRPFDGQNWEQHVATLKPLEAN